MSAKTFFPTLSKELKLHMLSKTQVSFNCFSNYFISNALENKKEFRKP
jgi:hypothetical protein